MDVSLDGMGRGIAHFLILGAARLGEPPLNGQRFYFSA
jgi:hypothetical protein